MDPYVGFSFDLVTIAFLVIFALAVVVIVAVILRAVMHRSGGGTPTAGTGFSDDAHSMADPMNPHNAHLRAMRQHDAGHQQHLEQHLRDIQQPPTPPPS